MKDSSLEYLDKSGGWDIGVGPSIVVVDKGTAGSLTTTTAKDDIYAFFFDQEGLMAGMGLQGSKITKINKDKEEGKKEWRKTNNRITSDEWKKAQRGKFSDFWIL